MKFLIIILFLSACQKEEVEKVNHKADKYFSNNIQAQNANSLEDDFSDLKKVDDESCEDEEAIEKKLVETKKAFKLQGQKDEDCQVQ